MARVLITAGPTREPLDPVRYISNASTGRQGIALALAARRRGWQVDLVHGPLAVDVPAGAGLRTFQVTTTSEMMERCGELHAECDLLVGAAAVCDYRPVEVLQSKHKRTGARWTIDLEPTPDILATLGARKEGRVHVGFALESDDVLENARRKLEKKNLDWIVANSPAAIGAISGRYYLLGAAGAVEDLGELTKEKLAERVLGAIGNLT